MLKPPQILDDFQDKFSRELRGQNREFCFPGIPKRAANIYRNLVFNNLRGFIDRCFPVAQTLVTEEQWQALLINFFQEARCHSPIFNEIPFAFVNYVYQLSPVPNNHPWLADLLHYEWLELFVDLHPERVQQHNGVWSQKTSLQLNPTLVNQHYNWPVHQLCADYIPPHPQPTHLLVFRNSSDQIRFMEVNPLTSSLLCILEQHPNNNTDELLNSLCALQPDFDRERILTFGQQLIADLIQHDAILSINCEKPS